MAEMKRKIPVITGCYQCPQYRYVAIEHKCMHPDYIVPDNPFGREIENHVIIQDWCPLEDYSNNVEVPDER